MHTDARTLEDDSLIEADICIVGAGAAGIALALELKNSSLTVALLEGGGFDPEVEMGLFIAIVEPEITLTEDAGLIPAGTTVNNVLRKLLPSGAGRYISEGVAMGQVIELDTTWAISGLMNPNSLRVIAYAQDLNSRLIYQATFVDVPLTLESPLSVNEPIEGFPV